MSPSFEDRLRNRRRLEDQIRNARHHIELGRAIIEYHRELLAKHHAEGRDIKPAEALLAELERSQKVFELDLAELERRREAID